MGVAILPPQFYRAPKKIYAFLRMPGNILPKLCIYVCVTLVSSGNAPTCKAHFAKFFNPWFS